MMAAEVPQIIFGHPGLLGNDSTLLNRRDLFWSRSIKELESIVNQLFIEPTKLLNITVNAPPY